MAMGGGLALSDRRYALAARKQREVEEAKRKKKPETVPASAAASVRVDQAAS